MEIDQPNSVIRWGILGTGMVAQVFAEDLRLLPDAILTSVTSRRLEQARAFAGRFGINQVHEGVAGLLDDKNVDVVYVASPHVHHVKHCLACLASNKAVLCEKPFMVNAAEGRAVIEQAQRSRRFCMEAMWMRFNPLILKVRSMIESGAVGTIRLLTADFGYPTPFDPKNRFFDRELGGGALLDRAVYPLSLAYFLLGPPEEVVGRATIGPTGVDEQESLVSSHAGGALATLTASLRSRLRNEALIVGTEGMIRIHEPFYAPSRVSHSHFTEPLSGPLEAAVSPSGWKRRLKRHPIVRHAFDAIVRPTISRLRRGVSTHVKYYPGSGYQFEAAEVMRCLRAGDLESSIMPLSESLAILETTDRLRESWGLCYPGEND